MKRIGSLEGNRRKEDSKHWKVLGEECSLNAWRFEDLGDPISRRVWSLGILDFWKGFKALDLV